MNEFTENCLILPADLVNLNPRQGPGLLLMLMHLSTQSACESAGLSEWLRGARRTPVWAPYQLRRRRGWYESPARRGRSYWDILEKNVAVDGVEYYLKGNIACKFKIMNFG